MLGVGFEPTHPKILELESSALDHSAIQAIEAKPKWGTICEFVFKCFVFLYFSEKKKWSIRVSIPVPRACKARTLPIELMPQKIIPGGTWTPNLLIRSQTPCPIGPQGLYNMWPLRLSTLLILKLILGPKKGCCRNRTSDRRICNPMLYRWAKHPWSRYAKVEPSFFFLIYRHRINGKKVKGAVRKLNPRPLEPEARIVPLDQRPAIILYVYCG